MKITLGAKIDLVNFIPFIKLSLVEGESIRFSSIVKPKNKPAQFIKHQTTSGQNKFRKKGGEKRS